MAIRAVLICALCAAGLGLQTCGKTDHGAGQKTAGKIKGPVGGVTGIEKPQPQGETGEIAGGATPAEDTALAVLAVHNAAREAVGVPPLVWSDRLAQDAAPWADHLARMDHLEHSLYEDRAGEGENLAGGPGTTFSAADLVGLWTAEQANYRPGAFPDISITGDWTDVGHYTQVVWRGTSEVGCAFRNGPVQVVLVCRYSPPGNYAGQRAF